MFFLPTPQFGVLRLCVLSFCVTLMKILIAHKVVQNVTFNKITHSPIFEIGKLIPTKLTISYTNAIDILMHKHFNTK